MYMYTYNLYVDIQILIPVQSLDRIPNIEVRCTMSCNCSCNKFVYFCSTIATRHNYYYTAWQGCQGFMDVHVLCFVIHLLATVSMHEPTKCMSNVTLVATLLYTHSPPLPAMNARILYFG